MLPLTRNKIFIKVYQIIAKYFENKCIIVKLYYNIYEEIRYVSKDYYKFITN